MPRPSYSVHYANSAAHDRQYLVTSELLRFMVTMVETTPGVKQWSMANLEAPFVHGGKERVAVLKIAVQPVRGSQQLWQAAVGYGEGLELPELEAGRSFADARRCQHVVVTERSARERPEETRNRCAAHTYLVQGAGWDTQDLEARAVVLARKAPRRLSELANDLGITATQMRLVFIRMWLRELVEWDLCQDPLLWDMRVRARHG